MNPAQIEAIAIVCHETNRAYCEMLGDRSQVPWESAPDWQQSSAIDGVQFRLDNPLAGPEASHLNWLNHKTMDGWTYGPAKDAELKTHPCMVAFDKLPAEQRFKDVLFMTVVNAVIKAHQLTGA